MITREFRTFDVDPSTCRVCEQAYPRRWWDKDVDETDVSFDILETVATHVVQVIDEDIEGGWIEFNGSVYRFTFYYLIEE